MTMKPSNLVAARPWHLIHLAEHMRPDEQANFLAIVGGHTYKPDLAVKALIGTPGMAFAVIDDDGTPVVAGGYTSSRGHAWDAWMVGTMDGWESRWRNITKAVRWSMDEMFKAGVQRIAVTTITSRTQAIEWYERALAMRCEGILRKAGANGEDLAIYARVAGDNDQ